MEENIIGQLIFGYGLVTVLLASVFFIVYLPLEFHYSKIKKVYSRSDFTFNFTGMFCRAFFHFSIRPMLGLF